MDEAIVDVHTIAEVDLCRITSYNVCYTKLLRRFTFGIEQDDTGISNTLV